MRQLACAYPNHLFGLSTTRADQLKSVVCNCHACIHVIFYRGESSIHDEHEIGPIKLIDGPYNCSESLIEYLVITLTISRARASEKSAYILFPH